MAQQLEDSARDDLAAGHRRTAGQKLQRASNYLAQAERMQAAGSEERIATYQHLLDIQVESFELIDPATSRVEIPFGEIRQRGRGLAGSEQRHRQDVAHEEVGRVADGAVEVEQRPARGAGRHAERGAEGGRVMCGGVAVQPHERGQRAGRHIPGPRQPALAEARQQGQFS